MSDETTEKSNVETTDTVKSQPDVMQRHPDSEILYIGCKDETAIELINAALGEKFKIFVLSKANFNLVTERMIADRIKWQEDQKILEFTKNAEKIQEMMQICKKVEDKVGANTWFSLKNFIDETNFTYKHAHSTMDLLFAFGFLIHDKSQDRYKIVADPRVKLAYVKENKAELLEEVKLMEQLEKEMEDGIGQALAALTSLNLSPESTIPAEGKIVELPPTNIVDTTKKKRSPAKKKTVTTVTDKKPKKK